MLLRKVGTEVTWVVVPHLYECCLWAVDNVTLLLPCFSLLRHASNINMHLSMRFTLLTHLCCNCWTWQDRRSVPFACVCLFHQSWLSQISITVCVFTHVLSLLLRYLHTKARAAWSWCKRSCELSASFVLKVGCVFPDMLEAKYTQNKAFSVFFNAVLCQFFVSVMPQQPVYML